MEIQITNEMLWYIIHEQLIYLDYNRLEMEANETQQFDVQFEQVIPFVNIEHFSMEKKTIIN